MGVLEEELRSAENLMSNSTLQFRIGLIDGRYVTKFCNHWCLCECAGGVIL